ncbi:contact-dependent growth inhibition system immunity protein [Mycobacterium sp. SMC-4]|uniref:contact-dependent growth inhibition system immunity protein n=1 Tax=Mycobacterium sp. SMC-4 TaxID=2857059 RepID=UPI003D05F63F
MNGSVSSALEHFFGAYLHQDWTLEAEDWRGIVDPYSSSTTRTPEQIHTLARHTDELRVSRPDSELATAMMEMGGFDHPEPEMTYAEWMRHVAERLRERAVVIGNGSSSSG